MCRQTHTFLGQFLQVNRAAQTLWDAWIIRSQASDWRDLIGQSARFGNESAVELRLDQGHAFVSLCRNTMIVPNRAGHIHWPPDDAVT